MEKEKQTFMIYGEPQKGYCKGTLKLPDDAVINDEADLENMYAIIEKRLAIVSNEVELTYEMMGMGMSHKDTWYVIKGIAKKTRIEECKNILITSLGEENGKEMFKKVCNHYGLIE